MNSLTSYAFNSFHSPLILVINTLGVEIWVSKLKLRLVLGESLVTAHVKVPKNPRTGFSVFN